MSLDAPPEVHPPHGHKKEHGLGRPPAWLEWFTSIAALIVSISSIFIALRHGETMDRLVKANSYPYLIAGVSDATLDGRERIYIDFINNGVGPADERSFRIKLGDHYVTSIDDLIRTALGPGEAAAAIPLLTKGGVEVHNDVPTRFIAPKDKGITFAIDKTPANARYWEMLDATTKTKGWLLEYCYCSVFEECWAVKGNVHTPVKQCVRDEPHEFMP